MALKIKQGDLFSNAKAPCVIVHGCNAQGVMASGFADKLRMKFPDAYSCYKKAEKELGLNLGDVSVVSYQDGTLVANAITQEFYGRDKSKVYVDYEAVERALEKVAGYSKQHNIPVHLPFIGGGLANGDRSTLEEIFKRVFEEVDATLWIY